MIKLDCYQKKPTTMNKNKLVRAVINTIRQCMSESEYSALCATILHSCEEYVKLKNGMQECGLWTQELANCDNISRSICLFR